MKGLGAVVAGLVTLLAALLMPLANASAFTTDGRLAHGYAYGAHRHAAHARYIVSERGPPPAADPHPNDVLDHRLHGSSAPLAAAPSYVYTGYDVPASLVQVDKSTDTTARSAAAIGGNLSSLQWSQAAAKTDSSALDALSPAARSNVDDAIQRAAAGKIRFPGHDGKVYNNSDALLPRGGNYTEWTAAQAGAKRGADRVIIEGDPAKPNAIYCWDHVNPPVRIGP